MDEPIHIEIPSDIAPTYSEAPTDQSNPNLNTVDGILDHAAIEFSMADEDAALTPLGQGHTSR